MKTFLDKLHDLKLKEVAKRKNEIIYRIFK